MGIDPTKRYTATMETSMGTMVIALDPIKAPKTVNSFVFLALNHYFDGIIFHRIINGFVCQGGDPTGTGTGGPGYQIKAEFNPRPHVKGVLSMARSSNPDSAGSQFFICHGVASSLNNQYTAFGQLVSGEEVLNKIANIRCVGMEGSTPTERVEITSVELVEAK